MQHDDSLEGESSCDNKPPPGSSTTVEENSSPQAYVSARSANIHKSSLSWNDWRWQIRHRIRTIAELKKLFPSADISGIEEASSRFPMAITPYYASLIRTFDNKDPIFRMSIPQLDELIELPCLKDDPLEEEDDMPVPGLIHRYPDRALVIATTMCSMYCRHCTRKRVAGHRETSLSTSRLQEITAYIEKHTEIKDVIISGGDPLTMETAVLDRILSAIRNIPSVELIRIGTRVPVVMPMRITDELVAMLKKYHPLYINTHFNHPREITSEAVRACEKLADAGIPLGNQTVLLCGVNDDPKTMEELCRGLVKMRVKPYYLFQCDLVRGVEHFRTPISRGIEIMEYLRGRLSGLAIPLFVVDAPHGGGKIPISPNYIVSMSPTHTVLRNYEGMLVSYPEPSLEGKKMKPCEESAPGVWELASGRYSKIQPQKTIRHTRRSVKSNTNRPIDGSLI